MRILDDGEARLIYYMPKQTEIVGPEFMHVLEDGIKTILYELWLQDVDFNLELRDFNEWKESMEDIVIKGDLIGFWETWRHVDYDGAGENVPTKEKASYDKEKERLSMKHKDLRAAIEAEAIRIGL